MDENSKGDVYFVYDGECPICQTAAQALQIRKAVGALHLVNARTDVRHPVLMEVNSEGYDLDESMVLKYGNRFYCGPDALVLMALLGTDTGWFNRMNAVLFRSQRVASLLYPLMRGTRNLLIRVKGVPKIHNLAKASNKQPIFQPIFGSAWAGMPDVLRKRYANRPYATDVVRAEGRLDITASPLMRLLSPLLKFTGMLVPYEGKQVPVTVHFRSEPHSAAFCLDREFRFAGRTPYVFRSDMIATGGDEIMERLSLGICWKASCFYHDNKVKLVHRGYCWQVFGLRIPLPFQLVFGKGSAEEEATGPTSFRMKMDIRHPLFGHVFGYQGRFEIKAMTLDP